MHGRGHIKFTMFDLAQPYDSIHARTLIALCHLLAAAFCGEIFVISCVCALLFGQIYSEINCHYSKNCGDMLNLLPNSFISAQMFRKKERQASCHDRLSVRHEEMAAE